MPNEHANVALLKRLDLNDLDAAAELFAPDVVWHYFNPRLPDVNGDYVGLRGIRTFFETISIETDGSFEVQPVSSFAIGDELVVAHTINRLTFQGSPIAIDVVTVWRFADGRIAEFGLGPTKRLSDPGEACNAPKTESGNSAQTLAGRNHRVNRGQWRTCLAWNSICCINSRGKSVAGTPTSLVLGRAPQSHHPCPSMRPTDE